MKKTNNQFVKNINHLIELINNNHNNYAVSLAGGLIFSRKTITYDKKTKKFKITNHIDNTQQYLTKKQLSNEKYTNIGKAIPLKSLIAIIN